MYYQFKRTLQVTLYSVPVEADSEKAAAKLIRKQGFRPLNITAFEDSKEVYEYDAKAQTAEGFGEDLNENFCVEMQEELREDYDLRFRSTDYPLVEDDSVDDIVERLK